MDLKNDLFRNEDAYCNLHLFFFPRCVLQQSVVWANTKLWDLYVWQKYSMNSYPDFPVSHISTSGSQNHVSVCLIAVLHPPAHLYASASLLLCFEGSVSLNSLHSASVALLGHHLSVCPQYSNDVITNWLWIVHLVRCALELLFSICSLLVGTLEFEPSYRALVSASSLRSPLCSSIGPCAYKTGIILFWESLLSQS